MKSITKKYIMKNNLVLSDNEKELYACDVLLKEHEAICGQIKEIVSYSDKMLALFITITGSVVIYGIKEKLGIIIVIASFVVMILMLFVLTMNSAIMTLGGYRLYLEEQLNTTLNKQYIHWERVVSWNYHTSVSIISFKILAGFLFIIILYFGVVNAQEVVQNKYLIILLNVLYVLGVILIGVSFIESNGMHKRSYELAKSLASDKIITDYDSHVISSKIRHCMHYKLRM